MARPEISTFTRPMNRDVEPLTAEQRSLHDLLLPHVDPSNHPSDCAFCAAATEESLVADSPEIKAPVPADAQDTINALTAEIAELKAAAATNEHTAQVEALTAQVAELTSKLDTAVAEATAAEAKYADTVAYLEAQAAEAAESAARAERRESRAAAVAALQVFPETHIEENADRWAEQSDDQFAATLADYEHFKSLRSDANKENEVEGPAGDPADPTQSALQPTTATEADKPLTRRDVISAVRTTPSLTHIA